jgi:hypothetical protein
MQKSAGLPHTLAGMPVLQALLLANSSATNDRVLTILHNAKNGRFTAKQLIQ